MAENTADNQPEPITDYTQPVPTGRQIVLFKEGTQNAATLMASRLKMQSSGYKTAMFAAGATEAADALVIEELGVAFLSDKDEEGQALAMANDLRALDEVEETMPEFYAFAIDEPLGTMQAPKFSDDRSTTWGVKAVQANSSRYTGNGIKIAVLDTGIDMKHPDLAGKVIASRSFVAGEAVQDGQGHGTHCAGTAVGRMAHGNTPRYGVAPDASLIIGKVLSNQGRGRQQDIIEGMMWAVSEGAHVISMSLGRATGVGQAHDPVYERAAKHALNNGSIVVAAAGNSSNRKYGYVAPVGAPANSPSALAVAAVDASLDVAGFSCGGINGGGGAINVAAPGVRIFSSVPMPEGYKYLRGTSMACPHVAGVAALWAQQNPANRSATLWQQLENTASNIGLSVVDGGKGLVQAP